MRRKQMKPTKLFAAVFLHMSAKGKIKENKNLFPSQMEFQKTCKYKGNR